MKKIISIAIAILAILLLVNKNIVTVVGIVEDSGYVILDNKIEENLNKEEIEINDMTIEPYRIKSNDAIYEKNNSIYIGEERVKINEKFPIITNSGKAINIVTNFGNLIDTNFTEYETFPNILLSGGGLYQSLTRMRLDANTYILYRMENNLYLNLTEMEIIAEEKNLPIPLNSIIKFNDTSIKLYTLEGNYLIYKSIGDLDNNSKIKIDNKEYRYSELLDKINNKKDKYNKENDKENFQEVEENIDREEVSHKEENEENSIVDGIDNKNTLENIDKNQLKGEEYKEPSIILVDINTGVYSLTPNFNVEDIQKRITYPIDIKVYDGDNMVLRKSVNEEDTDYLLPGLKPNREYSLSITYKYYDSNGKLITKEVKSSQIKTKDISELSPIDLTFEKGDIYNNAIEIKNISINSSDNVTKEAIQKISIVSGNKIIGSLEKEEIIKIKEAGVLESIKLSNNIESNKEWNIKVVAYDKYENELPVNSNKLTLITSKLPPIANLKVEKNNFTSYEIKYSIDNVDNVEIINPRYEVVLNNTEIEMGGALEFGIINLNRLKFNSEYFIKVYADYNLGDNKGLVKNNFIGELRVKTSPLNSLGSVNIKLESNEIDSDSFKLELSINKETTNENLIYYINKGILKIKGNEEIEVELTKEEIEKLKNGSKIEFEFNKLDSNTNYNIDLNLYNIDENDVEYYIKTTINKNVIITNKKDANVIIENIFTTEEYATFSIYIKDDDEAIKGGLATLRVVDKNGKAIYTNVIEANKRYDEVKINNIVAKEIYDVSVSVAYYNITNDSKKEEKNKILMQSKIKAENFLEGSLNINELNEKNNNSIDVKFKIEVKDNYSVLSDNTIYVKQYKYNDDKYELQKVYSYKLEKDLNGVGSDSTIFKEDVIFNIEKGKYKFELVGDVYGKEFEIVEPIEFNAVRTSKVISNIDEFKQISKDTNSNYLVIKNLDFSNEDIKIIEEINGIIDFSSNIITLNIRQGEYSSLFSRIGKNGEIRNIKLKLNNYETGYDGKYGLVENNYGKIMNIQVEFDGTGEREAYNTSAISKVNYGVIENFIVKVNGSITTTDKFGLVTINNYGTIKNGYLYGDKYIQLDSTAKQNRIVGGLIGTNEPEGEVEGVYSYIAVNGSTNSKTKYIGNVIGKNLGKVNNVYSEKIGENLEQNYGPTIGYNDGSVSDSYYYLNPDKNEEKINNSFNTIVEAVSLQDEEFMKSLYDQNIFKIYFSNEYLYYPIFKDIEEMNFDQSLINLPIDESLNRTSIVSTRIENKTDSDAIFIININNLDGEVIEVNIPDTYVEVVSQVVNGRITTVTTKVKASRYYEEYEIKDIKYRKDISIKTLEVSNRIKFDFYRAINTVDEWNAYMLNKEEISNKKPENFSIESNLDFQNKNDIKTDIFIEKLKGNDKTLSNINLSFNTDNSSFIYKVNKSMENLNFQDVDIKIDTTNNNSSIGFIYWNYGSIKNVNFNRININKEVLIKKIPDNKEEFIKELESDNLYEGWYKYINPEDVNRRGDKIAPIVYNDRTIENVSIKNSIIIGSSNVGGLLAINNASDSIRVQGILSENNITISTIDRGTQSSTYLGGVICTNRGGKIINVENRNSNILSRFSRVGGVIGYNTGVGTNTEQIYISDSLIYGYRVDHVGGAICYSDKAGVYMAGSINSSVVGHKFLGGVIGLITNTTVENLFTYGGNVRGESRVGGVLGTLDSSNKESTIKNIYSFTDVYGGLNSNDNNIGGIGALVGNLINGKSTLENAFVGGTVKYEASKQTFIGIVGRTTKQTSIKNILNYASYEINPSSIFNYISGDNLGEFENIWIWEGTSVRKYINDEEEIYGADKDNSVTSEELQKKEFYIEKLMLNRESWSFDELPEYMPKLLSNGSIMPNQINIEVPKLNIETLNSAEVKLLNTYTVAADNINLEFNKVDKNIDFEIFIDDKSVLKERLSKKIFTLQYDFISELRIELKKDGRVIDTYYVLPNLISRKVLMNGDKYYYITQEGIKTNNKIIKGDFVNIYDGEALTRSGELINIETEEVISSDIKGIKVLDETKPIFRFE